MSVASRNRPQASGEVRVTGAGPLSGLRVLDCGGRFGGYCGKLLAGLGADVIRLESVRETEVIIPAAEDIYFNAEKRRVSIDPQDAADRAWLLDVAQTADVVVEFQPSLLASCGIDYESLCKVNPRLVYACISAFGPGGPDGGRCASDLTLMARGGLMWLAGEPGRPPLRPAGRQSLMAASLNTTIGILLALRHAEATGEGQQVNVAALECIASALENAVQYWDLERTVRKRAGAKPTEAGSGLFACKDGYVYIMAGRLSTPRGWISIVEWLNEAGISGADELTRPEWDAYEYRTTPQATAVFLELFEKFASTRGKTELYEEGQQRGIVVCPLNTPLDLLADRQLKHRGFFVSLSTGAWPEPLAIPRGPFLLSKTPYNAAREATPPNLDVRPTWLAPGTAASVSPPGTPATNNGSDKRLPTGLPLAGIRVADFTWVGAGPFSTKILADHGAEVIKIESSTRPDALRSLPPFPGKEKGVNRSGYFANRNTSKESFTLNMSDPRGIELARQLIAKCDIVANSFTPGTMEKWGLGYDACKALRQDIIYLSMPMHGGDGPHGKFLGYGAAIGALSGLYASTGYPDGAPTGTGINYSDHLPNPTHATIAMLSALRHRERTGEGQCIELSQVESTICALGPLVLGAQLENAGKRVLPGNREAGVAPHGVYPCAGDDRWIAIACWSDEDWRQLCENAEGAAWVVDSRFANLAGRLENEDALDRELATWTRQHDSRALAEHLMSAGIDAASVQNAQEVVEMDPQLRHLNHWIRLTHAEMGETVYDAPPFHLSRTPGYLRSPAPLLGEHTEKVCREVLGLSQEQFKEMTDSGVFK